MHFYATQAKALVHSWSLPHPYPNMSDNQRSLPYPPQMRCVTLFVNFCSQTELSIAHFLSNLSRVRIDKSQSDTLGYTFTAYCLPRKSSIRPHHSSLFSKKRNPVHLSPMVVLTDRGRKIRDVSRLSMIK